MIMRTSLSILAIMFNYLALNINAAPMTILTLEQRCNYCADMVALNGIHECCLNRYCSGCYCYDKLRKGTDKSYTGLIRGPLTT